MSVKGLQKELNSQAHYYIEDSIPIVDLREDGLLKSINNKYAKSYKLEDIVYKLNDREGQRDILDKYKEVINRLDESVEFQFSILNSKLSNTFMENNIYYKQNGDGFDYLREGINSNIRKNIVEDNRAYSKEKMITISLEANNIEKAKSQIKIFEEILQSGIREIEGASLEPIKASQILKYLNSVYNINKRNSFYTTGQFLRKNIEVFTRNNAIKQGISAKELVQPSSMEFKTNYIKFGNTYLRALYVNRINKQIDTECVDKICSVSFNMLLTCKLRQINTDEAIRMAETELSNVEGDIYDTQVRISHRGGSIDLVPRNLKQRRDEAIEVNNSLKIKDEKFFDMSLFTIIYADSEAELNDNTETFKKIAKGKGLNFIVGTNMQENIFNSCMPYGLNQTSFKRTIDTEGATAFIPFSSQDLMQPNGDYYGKNKITHNPITYNLMSGDSYNSLIIGETGKGKSFSGKSTIIGRRLRNNERETIMIDPNAEWGDTVRELGGEEIIITAGGDNHINLFDIDIAYANNPLAEKEEFIINVCKQMLRSPFGLSSGQRVLIAKAVKAIYANWELKKVRSNIPTLEQFYEKIKELTKENNTEENEELCNAIGFYCGNGQNTLFQGVTDVNIDNSLLSYNIQGLGDDFKPLAMQVILDNIWVRICKNRAKGIPTDVIIDEFHLMFRDKITSEWMYKYWKMLRKFMGCPIGITQDPEDMLSNPDGRAVVNNTSLCVMLSLKEKNRKIMQEQLTLTNEQLKYITAQNPGEGLLYVQKSGKLKSSVVIPFSNPYDKDNIIYKLANTTAIQK